VPPHPLGRLIGPKEARSTMQTTLTTSRRFRVLAFLALAALGSATGCGKYHLEGRVIAGDASYITIVDKDHPLLTEGRGVGGASVHLQENPGRLNSTTLGRTQTNPDGTFAIPVDLLGAGSFDYEVGLFVRRPGFEPAEYPFKLPGKNKAALVVLKAGQDRSLNEDMRSIIEESMRAW
jgi:hypothetical protein